MTFEEYQKMSHAVENAVLDVQEELVNAIGRYSPFHSAHEGYAVILEELDELWLEVKKSPVKRDADAMRKEAVQVAAMALRFIHDICDRKVDTV